VDSRWESLQRLLIVRLDNLGDVLLATPAIHALRHALPDAQLTLFASPLGAPVAALNRDLDDVIVHRAPWMDPDGLLPFDPGRESSTIAELRRRGFDGAIIFTSYHQSSLPAAYLCYLAGIPLRHAASIDGPGSLLTSRHRHPNRVMHEVERGLDLVGGLGVPPVEVGLQLEPRPADRLEMAAFVARHRRAGRPVVAISPGSTCPSRAYPPERYRDLARLLQVNLGATIVWTGSRNEIPLVKQIREGLAEPGLCLAGTTDLSRLAALFAACDVVLTNNTGPMHVAAAVQTPVVALFALTNPPEQWRPWRVPHRLLYADVPCAICYERQCPRDQACLRAVELSAIVAAVGDLQREQLHVRTLDREAVG
jgi:ADP-heptose:LPS heptosyltransferase